MSKRPLNQDGFGIAEVIIVILVIILIGLLGYYFYLVRQKPAATTTKPTTQAAVTKPTTPAATPAASDPYSGWKSGTLQYEKISFKYPADWQIKMDEVAQPKGKGCVYPGTDRATLTGPNGATVILRTGIDCIGDASSTAFAADSIKALGQNLYLAFQNNIQPDETTNPSKPAFACLATTPTPDSFIDLKSKNILYGGEGTSDVMASYCFYPYNYDATTGDAPTNTVDGIKAHKDFANANLIFESMSY